MNFHFLNVENGIEVRNGNQKPNLTQYGPYAYRETRRKENLTHGGANSLYYKNYYAYEFDPIKTQELNCYNGREEACSDQDVIHVLNPIIAMIGPLLPEIPDLVCNLITSIPEVTCKLALNAVDSQIVGAINHKLDGNQLEQDDLIFSTTVDGILYSVSIETRWDNFLYIGPLEIQIF